jgi:hypothetical protein
LEAIPCYSLIVKQKEKKRRNNGILLGFTANDIDKITETGTDVKQIVRKQPGNLFRQGRPPGMGH